MKRDLLILLVLSAVVFLITACGLHAPGYMDAEYYYTTAYRLARGEGFTEPFLWNYLDDPVDIPHSSHTYWMPLTSLVSAGAILLFGDSFRAAQIPSLLLAILLPVLVMLIAKRFDADRRLMCSAGLIAVFSGYYLPYLVTTDSFTLYAWIGSGVLLLAADASRQPKTVRWFWVGVLTGLAYLTRADGLLLLLPAALAIVWGGQGRVRAFALVAVGYFLISGPWLVRNVIETGHVFPAGASRSLWLLSYNELFSYPASLLTPRRWLGSGIAEILSVRLWSFGVILQRLIAENGLLFLWPFMIVGMYILRDRREVRLAVTYLAILLGFMTFIYPFAGAYGGFFHSGSALMPILWAVAPIGLEKTIEWGAQRRKWNVPEAKRVFGISAIALAVILSFGLTWSKVVGASMEMPRWSKSLQTYELVGVRLGELDASPGVVAVNDPPGFYLATELNAVVIPNGPPETLRSVVDAFNVRWVVLDINHPQGLDSIYTADSTPNWMALELSLSDPNGDAIQLWSVTPMDGKP